MTYGLLPGQPAVHPVRTGPGGSCRAEGSGGEGRSWVVMLKHDLPLYGSVMLKHNLPCGSPGDTVGRLSGLRGSAPGSGGSDPRAWWGRVPRWSALPPRRVWRRGFYVRPLR